jgi:hypothetical protein
MDGLQASAEFECPNCHKEVQAVIGVPGPDLGAERISDMTIVDSIEVECPNCGQVFAAEATAGLFDCKVTLDDHPDAEVKTYVRHEPDEPWDDYEPPERPYDIFNQSDDQLQELLREKGSVTDGADLINRMVFAHYIAALEAYLADRLLNAIEDHEEAVTDLVRQDPALNKERFTLAEIVSQPDLVKEKVRRYVRDTRWHKLDKADNLYRTGAKLSLFQILGDKKADLLRAINLRHDCVHRNGYNDDGVRLEVFTAAYVSEIAATIRTFVGTVEGNMDFGGRNEPAGKI